MLLYYFLNKDIFIIMQETAFQRYCSVSYPDVRMILQFIMRMLFHILWLSFQACFKKLHKSYRIFLFVL